MVPDTQEIGKMMLLRESVNFSINLEMFMRDSGR
jgi:hypothetical protein